MIPPTDVTAAALMDDFAVHTGLVGRGGGRARRYLWTDAFAVCNDLGFYLEHRNGKALLRARRLVEQTHRVLGRHRSDDARSGWISGFGEEEGARHPTAGGLRIGKLLPERAPDEPFDPEREWDRDGQYFHYLTKWMHALGCMTEVTGDPTYHRWAVELAQVAHARFSMPRSQRGVSGLHWKMSIDLTRPLVPSMGHHDPLDGLLTLSRLQAGCRDGLGGDLGDEIEALATLCAGRSFETDDPLGIGGLLCDAWRSGGLVADGVFPNAGLLPELLLAALRGIEAFLYRNPLDQPATSRLAFREFGLSIGLHAVERLRESLPRLVHGLPEAGECEELLRILARHEPLAARIERFWHAPEHRMTSGWQDHGDINEVMFATSLAPDGFLGTRR